MKKMEAEFQERCRRICEEHNIIYDPSPVKHNTRPSKKMLRANENLKRYGLPKEIATMSNVK